MNRLVYAVILLLLFSLSLFSQLRVSMQLTRTLLNNESPLQASEWNPHYKTEFIGAPRNVSTPKTIIVIHPKVAEGIHLVALSNNRTMPDVETNLSPPPKYKILPTIMQATVEECQAALVQRVNQIQQRLFRQRLKPCPLLQSMVPVDGTYRLIFITEHMKGSSYTFWTRGTNWYCDGEPATLHANQRLNDGGDGGTFVISCPLTVQCVVGNQTTSAESVMYNTSLWQSCSDHNELQGIPEKSITKMVCTMFKGDHAELAQWIEYHHLIGFQHFLIYLHEPYNTNVATLPDATHITYIPWNFTSIGSRKAVPHQAVQQMDCIQRAQARNVTWMALMDIDEYFQIMSNDTLDDILNSHESDAYLGGLQLPSWFFGENVFENKTSSAANKKMTSTLVIDSIWRTKTSYRDGMLNAGREKMIVRPHQVVYFACHKIITGGPMKPEPRLRLNHYKTRAMGVFTVSSAHVLVRDNSLHEMYGPIIRQRLKLG